jgi:hypothetical protein
MTYNLVKTSDGWLLGRKRIKISRMKGFSFLEEAFSHPGKDIPLVRLEFTYNNQAEYSTPIEDWNSYINDDYIELCYQGAKEERADGQQLYRLYQQHKAMLAEKIRSRSYLEAEYHSDKLEKIKKIIDAMLLPGYGMDKMITDASRNAYNALIRTMKKIKKKDPILYCHLCKTFKTGFVICYSPWNDDKIELVVYERD